MEVLEARVYKGVIKYKQSFIKYYYIGRNIMKVGELFGVYCKKCVQN